MAIVPPAERPFAILGIALFLFVLNALLIRELFGIVYPASMMSIESAYIGLATHYQAHWDNLLWFPNWYGGLPVPSTYPPLLHMVVAATGGLFGIPVAHAYHVVTAAAYSLVPVAVFLFARSLTRKIVWPAVGALVLSVFSPSAVLISSVYGDLGGWSYPRRLQCLYTYGEGPHVSSLLWMFLALWVLHRAMESKRGGLQVLAALLLAATALTNTIGAAALALAVLAYLFSRNDTLSPAPWVRIALLGLLAYLLVAPMLPPSTILAIRRNAPFVEGVFQASALSYGVLVAHVLAGGAAAIWLRSVGANHLLRFSVAALIPLAGITFSSGVYSLPLLPQPGRYHLEMEIFVVLALVSLAAMITERTGVKRWATVSGVVLLAALFIHQVRDTRFYVRSNVQGGSAEGTIEYQSARWFAEHLPGERVYAPGSISQWLAAFADQPQIGGGYDNGVQNPNYPAMSYQILSGEGSGDREAEVSIVWLKTFGARAVQVSFPESPEVFHPFRNPAKFEGHLEELWRHRDTRIYRIPARHAGLAFVIPEQAVPTKAPASGLDISSAEVYAAALEDAAMPETRWEWKAANEAILETATSPGQAIAVQVSWHPGWRAFAGDTEIPVEGDALGQIILRPPPGSHRIRLVYTGGWERRTMLALWLAGLLASAWMIAGDFRQKQPVRP